MNNNMKKPVLIVISVLFFLIMMIVGNVFMRRNREVSMFSWTFELTEEENFQNLSKPLKEFRVTRLYQLLPIEQIGKSSTSTLVENLADIGIEMVFLTGDRNWIDEGLEEFTDIVDELCLYNESVEEELRIRAIALDVEAHTLLEWEQDPKACFRKYIDRMTSAKEYANRNGFRIIQVVSPYLDETDEDLFTEFLLNCCDELSIMNYNRNNAFTAIQNEVDLCERFEIPVETIFETMPPNDEHDVTEAITYFFDGVAVLKKDVKRMKEHYGASLGIAYHNYSTITKMSMKAEPDSEEE